MTEMPHRHLWHDIRQKPFLIPLCVIACVMIALLWLNVTTPLYSARMVIGPSAATTAARTARLNLHPAIDSNNTPAPVEISSDENLSDFARLIQLLTAPEIAAALLQDKELAIREELLSKRGLMSRVNNILRRLAGQSPQAQDDAVALADHLRRNLIIAPIRPTAMRIVTLRHADRDFAAQFLDTLYRTADDHLKERARLRTASEIVYLQRALQNVTQTAHRRALTELLAASEQKQMMINIDLPFAADQIEPAQAPAQPDWPSVPVALLLTAAIGLFIGTSWHYLRAARTWPRSL